MLAAGEKLGYLGSYNSSETVFSMVFETLKVQFFPPPAGYFYTTLPYALIWLSRAGEWLGDTEHTK